MPHQLLVGGQTVGIAGFDFQATCDFTPKLVCIDPTDPVLGSPDRGNRQQTNHAEDVGISLGETNDVRDFRQIIGGDRDGRGHPQVAPGLSAHMADHLGEWRPQIHELGFGRRVFEGLVPAPALGRVDMQAHLFQPAFDHQPGEQARVAQEAVPMGYQHRDQLDRPGVTQNLDHFIRVA